MQEEIYDTTDEWKIMRQLSKILSRTRTNVPESKIKNKKPLMVLDPANVLGIVAKTFRAKKILRKYISIDEYKDLKGYYKVPDLKYFMEDKEEIKSKLSVDYLTMINDFFKMLKTLSDYSYDSVYMKIRKDYPLTVENDDWSFILAPRVDDD